MDTKDITLKNGRHAGERIQRVPVSYLRWMINANHDMAIEAKAELDRRGTVLPEIEVSGHAIDRASLNLRKVWHQSALSSDEGIHAWLVRVTKEAWDSSPESETVIYLGMKFVFEKSGVWPVLKTIMPSRKKSQSDIDRDNRVKLDTSGGRDKAYADLDKEFEK